MNISLPELPPSAVRLPDIVSMWGGPTAREALPGARGPRGPAVMGAAVGCRRAWRAGFAIGG